MPITRRFRTTGTAAAQVLAGALSLDLQVEKEHLLTHLFLLNWNVNFGPIHFKSDGIECRVEKFRYHPTTALASDWVEALTNSEEIDQGVSVFIKGSITDLGVGSGVAIYENCFLVSESSYRRRCTLPRF